MIKNIAQQGFVATAEAVTGAHFESSFLQPYFYHNIHAAIHLSKYKSSVKDWSLFGLRLVQRQIFLIDFPLQSK